MSRRRTSSRRYFGVGSKRVRANQPTNAPPASRKSQGYVVEGMLVCSQLLIPENAHVRCNLSRRVRRASSEGADNRFRRKRFTGKNSCMRITRTV
jgi:hypothetical protein